MEISYASMIFEKEYVSAREQSQILETRAKHVRVGRFVPRLGIFLGYS